MLLLVDPISKASKGAFSISLTRSGLSRIIPPYQIRLVRGMTGRMSCLGEVILVCPLLRLKALKLEHILPIDLLGFPPTRQRSVEIAEYSQSFLTRPEI